MTRGALAEMRSLLLELRPTALTEAQLGDLLQQAAKALMGKMRVPVMLTVGDCRGRPPTALPPDVQITLYGVMQALNNIAKHAEAHQYTISLELQPTQVALSIRDDGNGFTAPHHR